MATPVRNGSAFASRNPDAGEANARPTPVGTPAAALPDVLRRARAAQADWELQSVRARGALVRRLREVLYQRRDALARCVMHETGKPLVEALFGDVLIALDTTQYYARNAAAFLRERRVPHHNIAVKAKSGTLHYEPYGVVGIIASWNYPLAIPLGQAVAAAVAGNAVVLKPSELAPASGQIIVECFVAAGFPPNVVQGIYGGGATGEALIAARPDKIVFTGSVDTGISVAEACARLLIPSVLELGGKDAMIVLADADLEAASSAAVWGSFTNCGQACLSVERVYVARTIAARFTDLCVAKTRALQLGLGSNPENEIGPLIRPEAIVRIESQIREAVSQGAQVLCGGHRRPDLGPAYFEPTVIVLDNMDNIDPATGRAPGGGLSLMQEETFGPVLAIVPVDSADQAVACANDSKFALSASIWTRDVRRARQLAGRIHAGAVMINDVGSYYGIAEAPHGGRGSSGWGRTHSRIGLMEMVQVKYIDVDWLSRWPKAWWFGYNQDVAESAGRFIDFLYAPHWPDRWRGAIGAWRSLARARRKR
jgi:acyl-CoA reductase-like NAD-dependent aldehyde dehydrogenase